MDIGKELRVIEVEEPAAEPVEGSHSRWRSRRGPGKPNPIPARAEPC